MTRIDARLKPICYVDGRLADCVQVRQAAHSIGDVIFLPSSMFSRLWLSVLRKRRAVLFIKAYSNEAIKWRAAGGLCVEVEYEAGFKLPFPNAAFKLDLDAVQFYFNSTVTFTFPIPPTQLHPNRRPHWRKKADLTADYRAACRLIAIETRNRKFTFPPAFIAAEVQIRMFLAKRQKPSDPDNLIAWLKAAFDGIQDSGVLANDRNLIHLPPVQVAAGNSPPRVEIWFEPIQK